MKKWLPLILTIILVSALCMYFFNYDKEYDFLKQVDMITQLDFSNPLDSFNEVVDSFNGINGNSAWYQQLFDTLSSIGTMLASPFKFIYEVIKNLFLLLQALLILFGINL